MMNPNNTLTLLNLSQTSGLSLVPESLTTTAFQDRWIQSSSSTDPVLQQAIHQSFTKLSEFSQRTDVAAQMAIAFGNNNDRSTQIINTFISNTTGLPYLEVIDGNILRGAYGAYSQSNDTIYLSDQFVRSGNVDAITAVLIEELGHGIDARLNLVDSAGDEGNIFSQIVLQKTLSFEALNHLRTEDDRSQISLRGEQIWVENSQDFNSDSQIDILWRNYASGGVGAWLMNGSQVQGWSAMQAVGDLNWRIEGTGDFNSDGQTDILWRNYASGGVGAWLMNGSQVQGWSAMQAVGDLNWRIEGTGDFNSDGQADILWRNYAAGSVGAWLMNGSQIQGWSAMQAVGDLNWRIEGTADFNSDGQTDVLWRNYASGGIGAWLMNGSQVQGWSAMQTVSDLSWQPIVSGNLKRDSAGNTIAAARDIGALSNSRTIVETIGGSDNNDYYRFTLTQATNFSLSLDQLSSDIDVELLDSRGNIICQSDASGLDSESIDQQLMTGTYYVRVYPYTGSGLTNYSLTFTTDIIPIAADGAGNTLNTARNVGLLNGSRVFQDFVGTSDTYDYYRFELAQTSDFSLRLNGMFSDVDVELLDANGILLQRSALSDSSPENITRQLTAGTYYIRLYSFDSIDTTYNLELGANPVLPSASNVPIVFRNFDINQVFSLSSNPTSAYTIYLDFDGHTTRGTSWNSDFTLGRDIITPAYDTDGDASRFSNQELRNIWEIWQRVSEDFAPFNVNVTTAAPPLDRIIKSGASDTQWGIRICIGGMDNEWIRDGVKRGGIAQMPSFGSALDVPAFVFSKTMLDAEDTAEAISHEVGHTMGLDHDGDNREKYYAGHGSGVTGWAPIMGTGYTQKLTQWSRGQYNNASNREDDLNIITTRNGFGYRTDDYGNSRSTASALAIRGNAVETYGIIETNSDTDWFSFTTRTGAVNLTINPFVRGPNLDILVQLYNSAGTLIGTYNPVDLLSVTLNLNLAAGTYFLSIDGTSKGDLATGYSDYGSLGNYSIIGTIA